jgi:cobalt-zinc-cadmium efflux system outer membrane protein
MAVRGWSPRGAVAAALVLGIAARLHAQAQGPAPLTLDAAIARATEANRALAAVRLARPVSAAGIGVAGERPNPDLTYEYERETPKQSFTFSLPIELGGKRDRRIELAQATVATTEADIARFIAELQNDVRHAYYAVVAGERRLELANEARALALRVRDAAATRAAAGDVPQLDVVQTNITLSNADQDVTGARGEVAAAKADLNLLIGQPADAPLTLAETLTVPALPSAAELFAQARAANPAIAVLDRRIAEQNAKRAVARSLQTPDLAATGALTYDAQPEFSVGYRASAGITLPLFTKHKAGVLLEDAELMRLQAERDATLAANGAAVTAALARATAAREQITRYQDQILPDLVRLDQMVQDGYAAGQTPLITLLATLQQTRDSRLRGLEAAIAYQTALADLERAVGTRLR